MESKDLISKDKGGGRKKLSMNKFADWEVGKDYECVKMLGSGSYGQVCSAIQKSTGRKVAIKRMTNIFDDEIDCKRILREIYLLMQLKNKFVVEMIDFIQPTNLAEFKEIYIVLSLSESDLKKVVKSAIFLKEKHIATIVYNFLCGLKYLHSANILHRDLKPANILINEDCTVAIADFGLSRSISDIHSQELYISNRMKQQIDADQTEEIKGQEKDVKMKGVEYASIQPGDMSPGGMVLKTNSQQVQEGKDQLDPAQQRAKMMQALKATKDQRKKMKRELTGHVVTRWYRAPELILLEKDYGPAIDMWSVGCVFAELLGMMQENAPTYLERSPLFPGKSCFPLSPDRQARIQANGFPVAKDDQLAMIFEVIGSPSEEDISHITDAKATNYLKSFQNIPRLDLNKKYPGSSEQAIDILDKMLQFNPYFRIKVDEALEHPYFKNIRNVEKEQEAPQHVSIPFENDELNEEMLREQFIKLAAEFKK